MIEWVKEGRVGPWAVEHFEFSREDARAYALSNFGLYEIPPRPGRYTRLIHDTRGVVMSDTPQELHFMSSMRWRLRNNAINEDTRGFKVHINGLGLGIVANWALAFGYTVTVCEIDPDVIALTGERLKEMYPDRLTIVQANAMDYAPNNRRKLWAVYHDIWDTVDSENWDQYKFLHRKWGRHTLWQDSWGRDYLMKERRREREGRL